MTDDVIAMLDAKRTAILDELVTRIVEDVPRYATTQVQDIRAHCDALIDELIRTLREGTTEGFRERITDIAQARIRQGFTAQDFVRAVLLVYPVVRHSVRASGPTDDPSFGRLFREIEDTLFRLVGIAVNVYTVSVARNLDERNVQLQAQNAQLRLHEQQLRREAEEKQQLLMQARELNQRVIDSLSTGVFVTEFGTRVIRFWSPRMEELLGLRAADVIGRSTDEVFAPLGGLPYDEILSSIRTLGRLPLTKIHIRLTSGRRRFLYLRGEHLRRPDEGGGGEVEGMVIVVDDITDRELLIDSFSRFVSREIVQRVLSRAEPSRLEGERRTCTIFFADLRGFSGIAEKLEPEALHELLNQYFHVVIEHIGAEGGVVDKFIGDNIMAVFAEGGVVGAAQAAARAALKIIERLAAMNRDREARNLLPLHVGIGLNSGTVVMGNVGTEERMNFTVIGDAVNVADRLQSMAQSGEILVGEETRRLLGDRFAVEDLGPRTLRGRTRDEQVFRLTSKV